MKDFRDVQNQLERALDTLMDAAEKQPDTNLAEAVDHVSAALTRLRATDGTEFDDLPSDRAATAVAPRTEHFKRKDE